MTIKATDASFEQEVLKSDTPVLRSTSGPNGAAPAA